MSIKKFKKDPNAVLDYTIDWSDWLVSGDEIINATAVSVTAGLTIGSVTSTANVVTVWVSSGVAGSEYDVVIHVTTAGGRQDDRTITIVCREL